MQVDPTGASGAGSGSSSLFGPQELGKEDFLRLLVTQLQHQDPLDPLDAQDFAAQLAEFTALEQQVNTNQLIEEQIAMTAAATAESRNSVAIGLIGTGIVAEGDGVALAGTDADSAYISSSGPATVRVDITSPSGDVVLSTNATVEGAGVHRVALGGKAEELEAGTYTVSVEVVGADEGVTARPLASGVVQGVRWGDAGPALVVGGVEIPLSAVLEINSTGEQEP